MNRFWTHLTLQTLDDRIVPDGTPLINPTSGYTPGDTTPTTNLPAPSNTPVTSTTTTALIATELSNNNLDDLRKQLEDKQKALAANKAEIARLQALIPGYDEAIKDAKAVVKEKSDNVKVAEANRKEALDDYYAAVAKDGANSDNAKKKLQIANEYLDDVTSSRDAFAGAEGVLLTQQQKRNTIDDKIKDLTDKNVVLEKEIADLKAKIAAGDEQ